MESRNWRGKAGPLSGSADANESHWPSGAGLHLQIAEAPAKAGRSHASWGRPHHECQLAKSQGRRHEVQTRRSAAPVPCGKRSARKFLIARCGRVVFLDGRDRRRVRRQRDAKALIARGRDDARAPVARRCPDELRKIGDALRGGKPADRPHRLFAVGGIDPRTRSMRDDRPASRMSRVWPNRLFGKRRVIRWLTVGREDVAAAPHRLDDLRVAGILLELLRRRLTCVSTLRSRAVALRPRARSSSWSRFSTRCGRSTKAISRSYSPVLSGTRDTVVAEELPRSGVETPAVEMVVLRLRHRFADGPSLPRRRTALMRATSSRLPNGFGR